jgi:hypothetical protein
VQLFAESATSFEFDRCVDHVITKDFIQHLDHYEHMIDESKRSQVQRYCLATFDGWSCWPRTQAGTLAFVQCPTFVPAFLPESEFLFGFCSLWTFFLLE